MAVIFSLNHLNATFSAKVRNIVKNADFDTSLIASQFIVFYKPDGTRFEKQATLEADEVNPSQVIALSNIVGDNNEDTITVTITATNLLKDGELMSVTSTTNFNVTNKPITIVDATTFTYKLGSVGSATPETSGNLTTQREKLITYQNTDPELSILDELGRWQWFAKIVLTNNDVLPTRDRGIFWIT